MSKISFLCLFIFCLFNLLNVQAQQRFPTLIRSSLEDEIIILTIDKPVYYPGDTVFISVRRNNSTIKVVVTPILIIEGAVLITYSDNLFCAVIPQACTPGLYKVRLRVLDSSGRRYIYATDCTINVEEHQIIEKIENFVHLEPYSGGGNIHSPVTLSREQIRKLRVVFLRDSIPPGVGPQFITINTTVILRDGITLQTYKRRVLTFRSDKDPNRDHAMLLQYRTAYGNYAAIRPEEFSRVKIEIDSLPDWAMIKINIEPDYTIKIGGYDSSNSYTRYFHVKGPRIEIGLSVGIPKVLFDTRANESMDYGSSNAMVRFYYVNEITGNRFPVNFGIGTFGVNSPIDVSDAGGGFALSLFLNLAEMTRIIGYDFVKKITAGIEVTPFFPIKKKSRFLLNAQIGFAL
ncbi:MAG: hypothetical protein V1773_15685 [bacterium]